MHVYELTKSLRWVDGWDWHAATVWLIIQTMEWLWSFWCRLFGWRAARTVYITWKRTPERNEIRQKTLSQLHTNMCLLFCIPFCPDEKTHIIRALFCLRRHEAQNRRHEAQNEAGMYLTKKSEILFYFECLFYCHIICRVLIAILNLMWCKTGNAWCRNISDS